MILTGRRGLAGYAHSLFGLLLTVAVADVCSQDSWEEVSAESTEAALRSQINVSRKSDARRALAIAKDLTQFVASQFGEGSFQHGRALAELGTTELLLNRHDLALDHLTQAEAILSAHSPRHSEGLIGALTLLGSELQSSGRHEAALEALGRAAWISQRLFGEDHPAQDRILLACADSFEALGDLSEAESLHRQVLRLYRVHLGARNPRTIRAASSLGTWLRSIGNYDGSIRHFHESLSELRVDGDDPPEAYPLLYGLAHAYRGGYRGRHVNGVYKRILRLITAHKEEFGMDLLIETHIEYGDWLMQRYYERKAVAEYVKAYDLADSNRFLRGRWLPRLGTPALVRYGGMVPAQDGDAHPTVRFRFDLAADGRPKRVALLEHDRSLARRAETSRLFLTETRFRPPIIEGRAVPLADQYVIMSLLPKGTDLEPEPIAPLSRLAQRVGTGAIAIESGANVSVQPDG